jgi:UDP-glucose 4-epimerase
VKILIVGATGFLGTVVTRRLARDGHDIVCLARSPKAADGVPGVRYVQATLDDAQAISEFADGVDFLLHFAWDTTPGVSKGQPTVEAINNLLPTFRLLEQLHLLSGCQLVFVSSGGAIYGDTSDHRVSESFALDPKSYYGAGKLAAEMFLRAYNAQTNQPVVIVRPANVYGPGQRSKRQFAIVPTLMNALRDESTFSIWGDGEATRDYLYAEDLADFFAMLTRKQWRGVNVFNLASERPCSINELCALLQQTSGRQLMLEHLPARGIDQNGVAFDCSYAQAQLQWTANTKLEDGLANTWDWFTQSS